MSDAINTLRKTVIDIVANELQKERASQGMDDDSIPKVVFIGHSAAGKSLLIKSLFGELDDKGIWAKTLQVVECTNNQLPEETIRQTLSLANLIIHVYSIRLHLPLDASLTKFIQQSGNPCILVLTQCDQPENIASDIWEQQVRQAKEQLGWNVTCVSEKTSEGLNELTAKILLSLPAKFRPPKLETKSLKSRQEACNKIISEAQVRVSTLAEGADKDLLETYQNMVKQIACLYLGTSSESNPPAPRLAFLYERLIRDLAKQVPIVGPIFGPTIGVANAWLCIYFLGRRSVSFYEKYTKEGSQHMTDQEDILEKIKADLETSARSFNVPEPQIENLTRDALLTIGTFLTGRPPIITFTGVTYSGKSSLINRLFGEKKIEEGMTSDTTEKIVEIRFRSGLLIYDTPGASGVKADLENVTRAYLGLEQLTQDVRKRKIHPIEEIPTIDAHRGRPVVKKPQDFPSSDLYIFVVSLQSGTLQGSDVAFYYDVATLGKPIIVVLNKVDDAKLGSIQAGLSKIKGELEGQKAIAVSAETGQNIDELVKIIAAYLPPECSSALGQTIDRQYHNSARNQSISLYSLIIAVKMAQLVGKGAKRDAARQLIAHVLGLYTAVISKYNLSVTDEKLSQIGLGLQDLLARFKDKEMMRKTPLVGGKTGLLVLAGTAVGAGIAGLLTYGAALPVIIPAISGGVVVGGPSGALVDIVTRFARRWKASDLTEEFQAITSFISLLNGYETAVSAFAFGLLLCRCCNKLEAGETNIDIAQIFQDEYAYALEKLQPFSETFNKVGKKNTEQERLIREIAAKVLVP